jgi:hypothetical protein
VSIIMVSMVKIVEMGMVNVLTSPSHDKESINCGQMAGLQQTTGFQKSLPVSLRSIFQDT